LVSRRPSSIPSCASDPGQVDRSTLRIVKALARAFRWRKLPDEGAYGTIDELAKKEKIAASYVSQVLRLTLLAPDFVEAILDGRQPAGMRLEVLLEGFRWSGGNRGLFEERPRSSIIPERPQHLPSAN